MLPVYLRRPVNVQVKKEGVYLPEDTQRSIMVLKYLPFFKQHQFFGSVTGFLGYFSVNLCKG